MRQSRLIALGAVAAVLAATPALKAQDTNAMGSTASDMSGGMGPSGGTIDYSVLANRSYDYMDLTQARASGLSDDQIASAAKIARKAGCRFSDVTAALLRGETFTMLANQYGLSLDDVYNTDDEKGRIADYKRAYETTGWRAIRAMRDNGGMSNDMSGGTSSTSDVSGGTTSTTANAALAGTPEGDVVDVAMATPQLSTLVKAIQAAGLVDTLKGAGPFTIFAPSNRAFDRLPKGQLDSLMADPTAMKNVLSYHIIAGQKVDAAAAMSMTSPTSPPTVQGGTLNVTTSGGRVHINDATVVRPDIEASNGIIHIINRVLMPPANATATGTTP